MLTNLRCSRQSAECEWKKVEGKVFNTAFSLLPITLLTPSPPYFPQGLTIPRWLPRTMDKAVSYHLNAYLARFYSMSSLGSPFSSLGQRKKKRLLFWLFLSSGDNLASGRFLNQSNVLDFCSYWQTARLSYCPERQTE